MLGVEGVFFYLWLWKMEIFFCIMQKETKYCWREISLISLIRRFSVSPLKTKANLKFLCLVRRHVSFLYVFLGWILHLLCNHNLKHSISIFFVFLLMLMLHVNFKTFFVRTCDFISILWLSSWNFLLCLLRLFLKWDVKSQLLQNNDGVAPTLLFLLVQLFSVLTNFTLLSVIQSTDLGNSTFMLVVLPGFWLSFFVLVHQFEVFQQR